VLLTREATNPASAASFAQQRTQLTLAPQLGLFVSNLTSLEVGLNSTIVWKRTQNPNLPLNLQRTWGSSFGVSLGMRFYFKNENEKFKFFLRPNVGYSWLYDIDSGLDTNVFSLGLSPNINYFLTNKLALELGFAGIGFDNVGVKTTFGTSREIKFRMGASSFMPSLGVVYFFK
jgi:hypothetical protein